MSAGFRLGVISDEISQDIGEAARCARAWGLSSLEIRSVSGRSVLDLSRGDAAAVRDAAAGEGLRLEAISSPVFKCSADDRAAVSAHLDGLRHCADLAAFWNCGIIRGFDFWAEGVPLARRAALLREAAAVCRDRGVIFALEYDPSVHSCTAKKIAETVSAVSDPCVRSLYDPGNGPFADPSCVPFPDDYVTLRDTLCHIHVKDVVPDPDGARAVCVGSGIVGWPQLLLRLLRDGYGGALMLETHYRHGRPLSETQLRLPGGHAFSDGAMEASAESAAALVSLVHDAQRQFGKESGE